MNVRRFIILVELVGKTEPNEQFDKYIPFRSLVDS